MQNMSICGWKRLWLASADTAGAANTRHAFSLTSGSLPSHADARPTPPSFTNNNEVCRPCLNRHMPWTVLVTPSSVAHTRSKHHNTKHGQSYISPTISPSLAYHTRAVLSEKSCTDGKHRPGLP